MLRRSPVRLSRPGLYISYGFRRFFWNRMVTVTVIAVTAEMVTTMVSIVCLLSA